MSTPTWPPISFTPHWDPKIPIFIKEQMTIMSQLDHEITTTMSKPPGSLEARVSFQRSDVTLRMLLEVPISL